MKEQLLPHPFVGEAVGPCLHPLLRWRLRVGTSTLRLQLVARVGPFVSWGAARVEVAASRPNKLQRLLFDHIVSQDVRSEPIAWSSRCLRATVGLLIVSMDFRPD